MKTRNGDFLIPKLCHDANNMLKGPYLNMMNIYGESEKLPEHDKHLLTPPDSLGDPDLYDIVHFLKYQRTNGHVLFLELIKSYYNLDRDLRVSTLF